MSARCYARALRRCCVASLALCLTAQTARPQTAPPRAKVAPAVPATGAAPAKPDAAKPDAAYEAARTAFEAMPEAERRAVQDALVWTGEFAGVVAGTFGRRTYDAIVAHQRASGAAPDGILDDRSRAALLATGRKAQEAAGFAVRQDAAAGIALGVPAKLLPRTSEATGGTRWQSADGRITLETRAYPPSETDLQAIFDRVSVATPQRKVTYKLKRPDFLVVSGETPTGRFYIRYADTAVGVRGFTVSYDKAVTDFDRVVIAISNSFDPAPARAVAAAPVAPAPTVTVVPAPSQKPNMKAATALAVAPGQALTTTSVLAGCVTPHVNGRSARLGASDAETGLVLLGTDDTVSPPPLVLGPEPAPGTALVVLPMEAGRATIVPGQAATAGHVVAPLQPGAGGAPVFDPSGRLVGLVASYPSTPGSVAGVVLPMSFATTRVAAAAKLLERAESVTKPAGGTETRSTGEIAAMRAPSLRTLTCE